MHAERKSVEERQEREWRNVHRFMPEYDNPYRSAACVAYGSRFTTFTFIPPNVADIHIIEIVT